MSKSDQHNGSNKISTEILKVLANLVRPIQNTCNIEGLCITTCINDEMKLYTENSSTSWPTLSFFSFRTEAYAQFFPCIRPTETTAPTVGNPNFLIVTNMVFTFG